MSRKESIWRADMKQISILLLCMVFVLPSLAQDISSPTYQMALEEIQEAERRNAYLLDLSGRNLTSLPPEIGNLQYLRILKVNENQLLSLPPEIGNLSDLIVLELSKNQLQS